MVVHWDGKLLPDLIGNTKVERIAVLVSYNGTSKFLGAPKVSTSSGENIAKAVHDLLVKWDILDRVQAMSFDTTSSNTGVKTGACVHLQQAFDRKLISFACRHHIYEIYLRSVFELFFPITQAPGVLMFERFANAWKNLNHNSFKSGLDDEFVRTKISDRERDEITKFCQSQLKLNHSRADYKEFLQLVLYFLGGEVGAFSAPGPTSHARWMAKGIYSLKEFLFREQFNLTPSEFNGLRNVCIFLVRLYIQAWFGSSNAIEAPNQDFEFIKSSVAYAETNPRISAELLKKMENHLWYLSEETIALAFFDSNVSIEVKKKMVQRLQSLDPTVKLVNGRKFVKPETLLKYDLSDFVSSKTFNFFTSFNISREFLQSHPSTWESNDRFKEGHSICSNLFVTNDTAERGVKFVKDYNRVLTNNEEEKQFLYQIVESYRKMRPSYKKSSLI